MANNFGGDVPTEVLNLGQGWVVKLSRLLAEGGFSYVFLGEDPSPQQQYYAVKKMNVSTQLQKKNALAEVELMKQFKHRNIIQCITTHSGLKRHSSTSAEFLYIVMEYCCPLPKMTHNEALVGNVFKQCVEALEYCHSFGLCHRDIKLENFMVGPDGYVKLIDFGSASSDVIKPEIDWPSKQRSIVEEELATVTTPMYRAPEIVSLWDNYIIDYRADLWALGATLYLMWFGVHPFPDSNKLAILNGKYTLNQEDICPNFRKLITGLLQVNPESRITYNEINGLIATYEVIKLEYAKPVFEDPVVPPNLGNSFPQTAASTTKSLFSSLKVGAESLFKNIRDNYYNPTAQGQRPETNNQQYSESQPDRRQEEERAPPPRPPKYQSSFTRADNERPDIIPQRPAPPSPTPARPPKPKPPPNRPPQYPPAVPETTQVNVDNLLNLGDDSTQFDDIIPKPNDTSKKTDVDLLADLFSSSGNVTESKGIPANPSTIPPLDLFSNNLLESDSAFKKHTVPPESTATNANLLDDLFGSGPSVVIGQQPIPPAAVSNPASATGNMPTSSSFTSLFLGGNLKQDELKKNVSSPNLTQLMGNGSAGGLSGLDFDLDISSCNPSSMKANTATDPKVEMKPNYSRSLFEEKAAAQPKPNLNSVFGEFLNDVGFTATSSKNTPQTMNELRMESNTKELDPITIKIRKWTNDGQKRKNIRALLSTLHTVTWPGCNWQETPMSQMIQPVQVKKVYRKACLSIHPDKQVGTEWETLAKSIFIELNEAWSYFSQEEQV